MWSSLSRKRLQMALELTSSIMVKAAVKGKGVSKNSAMAFENLNFAATRLTAETFESGACKKLLQGQTGSPRHCNRDDGPDAGVVVIVFKC